MGVLRKWTEAEVAIALDRRHSAAEAARLVGRTQAAVEQKRHKEADWERHRAQRRAADIGARERNEKSRGRSAARRFWSQEEDSFLLDTLDDPIDDVAACLERSVLAVANRRWRVRPR